MGEYGHHLSRRGFCETVLLGALAACAASGAGAAEPAFETLDAIAAYRAADRRDRLTAKAKEEGGVVLYSNAPSPDNAALVDAFQKTYGIKVQSWRAGSEEITQRMMAEKQAGRFDVDVVLNNAPGQEALHREGMLQAVASPFVDDILPSAVPPHREWVGFCFNVLLAAYNTNLISKDELPARYDDLLDPRWNGKLGIEAADSDWFAGLMQQLGEEKGLDLFRRIASGNGISVRKGHSLLTNLVAAGEVPLALTVFSYTAEQVKQTGAPLDWFIIPPLVGMPNSISVAKKAPHPAAAVLFFDFMLSDAQSSVLPDLHYVLTNRNVASPINRASISVIDASSILDDGNKWQETFRNVLAAKG